MEQHIHIHIEPDPETHRLLRRILANQEREFNEIMADLTSITTAVKDEVTVEESAIELITGLATQIESLKTDPAALQALADSLNAEKDKLAAAVAANTPAAPAPAPAPGP